MFGRQAGAILGIVDLVEVHHSDACMGGQGPGGCSPWAHRGEYHWVLRNPRRFLRSVPCSGALQVWNTRRLQTIVQDELDHQVALTGTDPYEGMAS
jgi:hypothetical protein